MSVTPVNVEFLLTSPPTFHGEDGAITDGWRLDDAALRFLDLHIQGGMRTIETGAGVSTIVFALKRTRHTCIVPDERVVRRIRAYCQAAGVSLGTVNFILKRSEDALPRLQRRGYDLALIDGRHGFPAPFIDWFTLPIGSAREASSCSTTCGSGRVRFSPALPRRDTRLAEMRRASHRGCLCEGR